MAFIEGQTASPQEEEQKKPGGVSCMFVVILIVVVALAGVMAVITMGQGVAQQGLAMGENVGRAISDFFTGSGHEDTLSACNKIPADWQTKFEQAADSGNASVALLAATVSAGEHRWYQGNKWPTYQASYTVGSEENPNPHDGHGWGGYVRGVSQMKEQSFQAYTDVAAELRSPSRLGTGFKVEPAIEETQPALNAAAKYLADHGGKKNASDGKIRDAIYHYNKSTEYIERVFAVYKEIMACAGAAPGGGTGTIYAGNKACPVIESASAGWGPVRRSNPYTATYPGHEGLDISGPRGSAIYSVTDGTVKRIGERNGWRVWIDDGHGNFWFYQHMVRNQYFVQVGDTVKAGQQIGTMSDTGAPGSGVHLHLGIARTMNTTTTGFNMRDWYWPYDQVKDVPCLTKTLAS